MANRIAEMVRLGGVVGAGGAGFPTHVKLDAQVELVLANGASCEPLLASDPYLMEAETAGVLSGLASAVEAVGASRGLVCVKKKHPGAIVALREAIAGSPEFKGLEVFELDDFYPAGDEQVLVHEVTGRVVPQGGIPLMVGAVVSNIESLFNIHRALARQPVTHRFLTVCGEVARPLVTKAPLGTPLSELIALAGGALISDHDILVGGPMMGRVADSADQPLDKTTSGVIVLPKGHYVTSAKVTEPEQIKRLARIACCQCSRCTDLCPRNLLGHSLHPHKIMRGLAGPGLPGAIGREVLEEALICSECGVCEKYACPMMISPREVNAALKRELMAQGGRPQKGPETYTPSSYLEMRRIPSRRLMERLQIVKYDTHPGFVALEQEPKRVVLPLKQHLGAPAKAVVKPGEKVAPEDLVGEIPKDSLGARVHASIGGVVAEVGDSVVIEA